MIQQIKNSYTKISPNNGNDNSKDYLQRNNKDDLEFQSSLQNEHSSACIDIEAILKESDEQYDNEQESKQSSNKYHIKEGLKSSTLICFKDKSSTLICFETEDAPIKVYN